MKMNLLRSIFVGLFLLLALTSRGQADTLGTTHEMRTVTVKHTQGTRAVHRTESTELIGLAQLRRAACCNLGESFTANPSVDVSYADVATGARQIKLLGLSGTYVQMLTENVPNLRGAAIPYSLGFVPGPWMQSIMVSKGASGVKNGYESTTGQINLEFLKPQGTDAVRGNVYFDTQTKLEANADAGVHLNDRLSTNLLLHFENRQREHDGNGDGFIDMPRVRQYNLMHRWAYVAPQFISQLSLRMLRDERHGGMSTHHSVASGIPRYGVDVRSDRYEGQWKNAWLFPGDRNASIALMLHASWHEGDYSMGNNLLDVKQTNAYAQLMYETDIARHHNIALGASLNHDRYGEHASDHLPLQGMPRETTGGVYLQYTCTLDERLTLMPGIRCDASSLYGTFLTPRLHLKYTPLKPLTLRASAGRGMRSPRAMAENAPMLASGRTFIIEGPLRQERAWNTGLSASLRLPMAGRDIELNTEYYYTHFQNQLVVNVDGMRGPGTVVFQNLDGRSYSHTLQVDATYPLMETLTATAAFRLNDARTTYDGVLRRRPLTSRYKGLLTLSYKTPMEVWQFDLTGHLNGRGTLYDRSSYPAYFQLQAQVTREFRRFSVYAGGENLTHYRMKHPVLGADDPWGRDFDATQVWGPTEGAMGYVGVRFKFEKF